jgi:hypothetical protein
VQPKRRAQIGKAALHAAPEQHPSHDTAGQQREGTGDEQRAEKQPKHGFAVPGNVVLMRSVNAERQHGQGVKREHADLAEASELPQFHGSRRN